MKKRYISIVLIFALVAFLLWWFIHGPANQTTRQPESFDSNQVGLPSVPAPQHSAGTASHATPNAEPTPESDFTAWSEKRRKQMRETAEKLQDEWRTPIAFYGKVVDQDTNPVAGAQIEFSCNDTSLSGTSFYHAESDGRGLFSIRDIKGKLLGVKVNKEGYYTYLPAGADFYYSGQSQNFVADPGSPVIFRLREKSPGESLIHFHKSFPVPRDGTPILIDLATGNVTQSSENAVKIEGWTHDGEKKGGWKYDWKCQVSIPAGGLQIYDEQFPFQAPQAGYVLSDVIDMAVTNNIHWTYDVQHNYYIHTADRKFGRMVFGMVAGGDNFCVIDSYFNPSGSRNLEPAN